MPKYEFPPYYFIIKSLADEIESTVNGIPELQKRKENMKSLTFGTLITGDLNARCYPVPNYSHEYVIVFEDDIFTFYNLLSKIVARCTPFEIKNGNISFSFEPDDIMKTIRENPQIVERFQDLVKSYLINGRASAGEQYLLESPYVIQARYLLRSMELFVMGHDLLTYPYWPFRAQSNSPVCS